MYYNDVLNTNDLNVTGEDGWQKVHRKGANRKLEGLRQTKKVIPYPNTTFYVSNLPTGCTAENLVAVFKEFRKVIDAYVALKKDKGGGVFGLSISLP
ncbi:hypothetical protein R6Q59_036817 [Mikania micrantha]